MSGDGITSHARGTGQVIQRAPVPDLVVCSLEPWDEVWRRNQFLTDTLLRWNPELRVLFVEPPTDPLYDLCRRRVPASPRLRKVSHDGRLVAFRPLKPLPRRLGPLADRLLRAQVRGVARATGLLRPTLWVNDVTYAPLIAETGWPALYDVTDDWLLAPVSPRELQRLRRLDELALRSSNRVVVCSESLAKSRGQIREVIVIPNGVDVNHFRSSRPRPRDLPEPPVAAYVGSLHDARLDVELVVEVATRLPQLRVVLIGPDSLSRESHRLLGDMPNVTLLGPRPYSDVPGYLQHADVILVPHRVTPFTESLDPIKAYECMAVDTPSVVTAVAGFRELGDVINVASRGSFVDSVSAALSQPRTKHVAQLRRWEDAASEFQAAIVASHRCKRGRSDLPA